MKRKKKKEEDPFKMLSLPIVIRPSVRTIATELVPVVPLSAPTTGLVSYIYSYGTEIEIQDQVNEPTELEQIIIDMRKEIRNEI